MNVALFNNIIFIISVSIPALTIILYAAILAYYGSKRGEYEANISVMDDYPNITILIPSYNEEKIIEKRLQNILNYDYPLEKMRVVFIDESTDTTPGIIQKYVDSYKNIELLHMNQRMGYSKAVFTGLSRVDTGIVVLNEAGSFPLPKTLKNQIHILQNPKIGAVTGHSKLLNQNENIGNIEALYLRFLEYIRIAESRMDTTIFIKGEATAYKTSLVKDIEAMEDTGSIDTSMAFMVRKKGYKTVYSPDVIFEEYAPSDAHGFRKQKMIRAANIMRNLLIFKEMLLNPKYGKFGLISMPFYLSTFFITPLLLPVAMISMIIGLFTNVVYYRYIFAFACIVLILLLISGRNILELFIELEISMVKAMYQIFIKKKGHDKIERVESTRRI